MISSTKLKRAFFTRKLSFPGALGTALGSALGLSWTSELLTGSAQWAVRPLQRNHNETMTLISCQLSRFPLSIPTIKSKHSKPESPHSSHFAFLCLLDWEQGFQIQVTHVSLVFAKELRKWRDILSTVAVKHCPEQLPELRCKVSAIEAKQNFTTGFSKQAVLLNKCWSDKDSV